MEPPKLLYDWVPRYLSYPVLTFLALVVLSSNGIFLGTTNDIYSGLGNPIECYTMAYNAMYIGMGLGMMFSPKLGARFPNKKLVLFGLISLLFFNFLCSVLQSPPVIVLVCFFLGFTKTLALGEIFVSWLVIWSRELDSSRLYPFFYFLALAGLYTMTWLTSLISIAFNWQYSYLLVLSLILLAILFAYLLIKERPLHRKVPLYQADLLGVILISISLMSLNYLVVFGKVKDWFSSQEITLSLILFILFFLLFIRRELAVKRPFVDLSIYKQKNIAFGLALFLILGIFAPSSLQSSFSLGILRYEVITNLRLNLYLIPGISLGCASCYFWYRAGLNGMVLILLGFIFFICYNILMYFNFDVNFQIQFFWFPSTFKGLSFSILYISIALYTTKFAPRSMLLKVAGSMVIFRSFIGAGLFTGLYNYYLYAQRIRHQGIIANNIDANAPRLINAEGTSRNLSQYLQDQANIDAAKEITGFIIIAGFIILLLLSLYFFKQYLKEKLDQGQPVQQ